MFDQQTKHIAENVTLLVVARVSMALSLPTIAAIFWLSMQWLDNKFDAQDAKIVAVDKATQNQSAITTTRIETVERTAAAKIETTEKQAGIAVTQAASVNERLIAVETKQTEDRASNERFQNATLQRLDRLQDSVVSMSNAVSALAATLQANSNKP
jgi:hypothetical protein